MNTIFGSFNGLNQVDYFREMLSLSRNKVERYDVIENRECFVFGGFFDLRFGVLDNFVFENDDVVVLVDGIISNLSVVKKELDLNNGYNAEIVARFIDKCGLDDALRFFDGAFAIVIYYKENDKIVLARDKSGVKPLYFGMNENNGCVFSSDYRHVLNIKHRDKNDVDVVALRNYLLLGYVPEGEGIIRGTFSVPHGSYLIFDNGVYSFSQYYSISETFDACIEEGLSDLLSRKVRDIVSPGESGILLSGGVDSPLVASYACEVDRDILCLTTTSSEKEYSEKETSGTYADIFGLKQQFVELTDDEVLEAIEDNKEAFTEPLCDFSTIPTLILAKHASNKGKKILVTGDAADELFYGYSRDWTIYKNKKHLFENKLYLGFKVMKGKLGMGDKIAIKLLVNSTPIDYIYEKMYIIGMKRYVDRLIHGNHDFTRETFYMSNGYKCVAENVMHVSRAVEFDYHLQRCLIKTDRSLRYYGIEVRSPFLTNEVMDYVSHVREELFFDDNGNGKNNLKLLLADRSKSNIPFLKKKGFSVPLDLWINGILRNEIDSHLEKTPVILSDIIDSKTVMNILNEHRMYKVDNRWVIWSLYSLFVWCEKCLNIR